MVACLAYTATLAISTLQIRVTLLLLKFRQWQIDNRMKTQEPLSRLFLLGE